jgi:hypothetical protein
VRFFLDNDVPDQIAWALRGDGHWVCKLREILDISAEDPRVLDQARQYEAILITCNRQHFLALCAKAEHYGVIIMKRRKARVTEAASVLRLVRRAGESGLVRNINLA